MPKHKFLVITLIIHHRHRPRHYLMENSPFSHYHSGHYDSPQTSSHPHSP
ncbi:MAG: hypothetical protein ABII21_01710 [bacterium]